MYEPTDADHSLAPYVPALGRAPAADEEATVTSLEPTPSASFVDLLLAEGEEGEHEGRTTTSNPDAASPVRVSSLSSVPFRAGGRDR